MLPYKVYDSLSGRVAHRLLVNGQDLVSGEKLAKGWAVCGGTFDTRVSHGSGSRKLQEAPSRLPVHELTSRDGSHDHRPLTARNEAEALSRVALDGDLSS